MQHEPVKILLVDDEERLLNSMGQRLTLMGFEVMKASSGTEAVEIAEKNHLQEVKNKRAKLLIGLWEYLLETGYLNKNEVNISYPVINEIVEHSIGSSQYGFVLSILWIRPN